MAGHRPWTTAEGGQCCWVPQRRQNLALADKGKPQLRQACTPVGPGRLITSALDAAHSPAVPEAASAAGVGHWGVAPALGNGHWGGVAGVGQPGPPAAGGVTGPVVGGRPGRGGCGDRIAGGTWSGSDSGAAAGSGATICQIG